MTFLPVVERELRVAARQRNTFWIRLATALVGAVILTGALILMQIDWIRPSIASIGRGLFSVLSWLTFAGAVTAGLFFTSDCLSREKREGTLGFLFLTDLRGYDVVLGKLLTHSLRSIYGLLALLPILATTLLMGGVTPGQFWMTVVALLNALLVSLAAGMFVSSISRDSQKALSGTLLLLTLLVGGGPTFDAIIRIFAGRGFTLFSSSSPGFLFFSAAGWSAGPFAASLLTNQIIFCALLGMSCLILPQTWQEKRGSPTTSTEARRDARKFGSTEYRERLRDRLLPVNPVLWLICRERGQMTTVLIATGLMFVGTVALTLLRISEAWLVWSSISGLLVLTMYLGIASLAARFFVEARRSGLIELLLATPLAVNSIIEGQRRAFIRWLSMPLALWIGAQLVGGFMAQRAQSSFVASRTPPAPVAIGTNVAVTNVTVTSTRMTPAGVTVSAGFNGPSSWAVAAVQVGGALAFAANIWALTWFGMWMGMTSQSTNMATLKTIAFVQVIPWFAINFLSAIVGPLFLWRLSMTGGFSFSRQLLLTGGVTTGLSLLKDILVVFIARRRLYADFRQWALGVGAGRLVGPARAGIVRAVPANLKVL